VTRLLALGLLAAFLALPAGAQDDEGVADEGDFKIAYGVPKDADHKRLMGVIKQSGVFEESLKAINDEIALPYDIAVNVVECGEANAFYDPNKKQILICYELAKTFEDILRDDSDDAENLKDLTVTATDWVLHHEIGHSLVHAFELPVVGKEEDAVDELATILYIRGGDDEAALVAANAFFDEGVEQVEGAAGMEDLAFWDEHSLSLQRYYSIVCLVIGSDARKHKDVATDNPELKDRGCEHEFQQKDTAWDKLLADYYMESEESADE
jgi:hypothetical protein